jgi:plasmid stabilization system protein ParE
LKRRVRLTSVANRDLVRLIDYLDVRSPSAALRAYDALDAAIRSLDEFSERARPGPEPGTRELIVPFGSGAYIVRYRVSADEVVVGRIFHGREDR